MDSLLSNIKITVNDHIYLKDPASSELGKKIVSGSIELIDEIGFEDFTFRKLASKIKTTEASVYRYFENKHRLLLYLTSWYWGWMEYRLVFSIVNIKSAEDRLLKSINLLTEQVQEDSEFGYINEILLNRIVIAESSKSYLVKDVDQVNKDGVFSAYKKLVQRVSDIILEINPKYKYPHMLVTTVIEGAHHQRFFAEHLPRLTDDVKGEDAIQNFYQSMVMKTIQK